MKGLQDLKRAEQHPRVRRDLHEIVEHERSVPRAVARVARQRPRDQHLGRVESRGSRV